MFSTRRLKWEVLFHPEFDPELEALAQEVTG
jgi:hypothetical protein